MSFVTGGISGEQQPRLSSFPAYAQSTGVEALELAALAGLHLDPWQAFVLERGLGERPDGKWAAPIVGACVPRQNGKGALLEARELAGLFLLPERLLVHSAHQFDTSLEHFRRLLFLIEDTPDLDRLVKRVSRSHGEEGIELKDGSRIRFRTRTKGGGRGFSADFLGLDEAMVLAESFHAALLPTLSARPNPQVWYTGSAVDQWHHEHGVVFARIRERGLAEADGIAWFEWSVDADDPQSLPDHVFTDPAAWAISNPGLGIRITEDVIRRELDALDRRGFAVERLCVGDWPATDGLTDAIISLALWRKLHDPESKLDGRPWLAVDTSPDRSKTCVAAAGRRRDGLAHIEVIEHKAKTGWIVPRLIELWERHEPHEVIIDERGPAAAFTEQLVAAGVKVRLVTASEYTQACGTFFDAVVEMSFRHLGSEELASAVRGARTRPLVDAWAWSRSKSDVDITPLVASTLALWQATAVAPVYHAGGFA